MPSARHGANLTLSVRAWHDGVARATVSLHRQGSGRALEPGGAAHVLRVQLRCLRSGAGSAWLNVSYVDEERSRGHLAFGIPVACATSGARVVSADQVGGAHEWAAHPRLSLSRCKLLLPRAKQPPPQQQPPQQPQQQPPQQQRRQPPQQQRQQPPQQHRQQPPRPASEPPQRPRGATARAPAVWLPIWFALPSLERFRAAGAPRPCRNATNGFAPVLPTQMGGKHTILDERSYYEQYARSLYGITHKKAGLDCLRHYEILGAGAVPYFLGLAELEKRPLTMLPFPRSLVRKAMELRGVPTQAEARRALAAGSLPQINWAVFDWPRYCAIRARLAEHTRTRLTTAALASYVLRQLHDVAGLVEAPRLLFVSNEGVEYQSGFLYHGLRAALGVRMSAWLGPKRSARKRILYHDHARERGASVYGKGFSYQGALPTPGLVGACGEASSERLLRELLDARLEAGYFNALVVTTAGNGCCELTRCYGADVADVLNRYLAKWPRTVVATVDGNDDVVPWPNASGGASRGFWGCHTTFEDQLARVDVHFLREVHEEGWSDGTGRATLPVRRPAGF